MKKLLYGGIALLLFSLLAYFNLENIVNWLASGKKEPQVVSKDELPYIKNEFVVTMPINKDSAASLFKYLCSQGLVQRKVCNCGARLELWGSDGDVKFNPDTDPPQGGGDTSLIAINIPQTNNIKKMALPKANLVYVGHTIARNYRIIDYLTPTESSGRIMCTPEKPIGTASSIRDSAEVTVSVIDTGVDTTVTELSPYLIRNTLPSTFCQPQREGIFGFNILNRRNEDAYLEPVDKDGEQVLSRFGLNAYKHGHGTFINGIIAGFGYYLNRPIPINTNVRLHLLNVKIGEKRTDVVSLFDALCAIHYSLQKGAKVINASWSIAPTAAKSLTLQATFYPTLVEIANAHATLVTSAGNDGVSNPNNSNVWPAGFSRNSFFGQYIITVGAWDTERNSVRPTSNQSNIVDIYAAGEKIMMYRSSSTIPMWQASQYGTSFAAAFVSREVAILKGQYPSLSANAIKQRIVSLSAMSATSHRVFTPSN